MANLTTYEDAAARAAAFAAGCAGPAQRGPDWYARMGSTLGGSEAAALMGLDPYKTADDVVASKVAIRRALAAGGPPPELEARVPCDWGALFEDVLAAVVEADLATAIVGADACVDVAAGQRYSPDGLAAVRWRRAAPEAGPAAGPAEGVAPPAADSRMALLEFKCPYGRAPDGRVPPQYGPQVQAGLAATPADVGVFVDARFFVRGADGGPAPSYHSRPRPTPRAPLAPEVARGEVAFVLADGAAFPGGARPADGGPLDLGAAGGEAVEAWLAAAAAGRARAVVLPPRLAPAAPTGHADTDALRGAARGAAAAYREARPYPGEPAAPPAGAAAVLPWTLRGLYYCAVERQPGFAETLAPLVEGALARVEAELAGARTAAPRVFASGPFS